MDRTHKVDGVGERVKGLLTDNRSVDDDGKKGASGRGGGVEERLLKSGFVSLPLIRNQFGMAGCSFIREGSISPQ